MTSPPATKPAPRPRAGEPRSGASPRPLRLDYVSPLPPVRSGIADYSADLLPHLAAREDVDLRLVRLPGQPVAEGVTELAGSGGPPLVAVEETGAGGRLPLYQMGNNHHHAAVLELALERPGVVTLHDLFLHHLLAERTLSGDSAGPYVEALERDHGWIGRVVATPRRWGGYTEGGTFSLAAHRSLVLRQRGVLVHSRWAAAFLAEEVPEVAVRTVPMGIPLPPAVGPPGSPEARAARRRLGLPEERPLLGSFGFQTPIKRTVAAVRALARRELRNAHLLVVGEVSDHVDLEGEARRAGVADRVHVTGFVDYPTFTRALLACDLALNLRYPTAGETSASLLRLLAAGRPALVSDYAQFRELPPEAVLRVPLGDGEEAGLAAAAAALLADPARLRAMGRAARDHVALRHAPEAAAAAIAAACAGMADREPPVAPGEESLPPDLPPPTSATWHRLEGEVEVVGMGPAGRASGAVAGAASDPAPAAGGAGGGGAASPAGAVPASPRELASPREPVSPREPASAAPAGEGVPARRGGERLDGWPAGERRRLVFRLTNRGRCRWLAARRGPGGVAFELSVLGRAGAGPGSSRLRDLEPGRPWLLLPRDVAPGESVRIAADVRRPPGPARLVLEPVVFDDWGGSHGRRPGPLRWEAELAEAETPGGQGPPPAGSGTGRDGTSAPGTGASGFPFDDPVDPAPERAVPGGTGPGRTAPATPGTPSTRAAAPWPFGLPAAAPAPEAAP